MSESTPRRAMTIALGSTAVLAAGAVAYRAYRDSAARTAHGPAVSRAITVLAAPYEAYDRWFELLPATMEPLADVCMTDESHARWRLTVPPGSEFTTVIERSVPGETAAWRNADAAGSPFSGTLQIRRAPAGRGTEVVVGVTSAFPPAVVGPALVRVLRRFKSLLETGEVPTLDHNPSARAHRPQAVKG